jgi:hypothetical protein
MRAGYLITMTVRIHERGTNAELMPYRQYQTEVQPPAWCDEEDRAVLELHLQMCGKMKYLFEVRKQIKANNINVMFLKDKDWSVRGTLLEYTK